MKRNRIEAYELPLSDSPNRRTERGNASALDFLMNRYARRIKWENRQRRSRKGRTSVIARVISPVFPNRVSICSAIARSETRLVHENKYLPCVHRRERWLLKKKEKRLEKFEVIDLQNSSPTGKF